MNDINYQACYKCDFYKVREKVPIVPIRGRVGFEINQVHNYSCCKI